MLSEKAKNIVIIFREKILHDFDEEEYDSNDLSVTED